MSDEQTDYSFMRTGFNAIEASEKEEETEKNVISLIVAYSEGAMHSAAKYLSHSKRNAVTPEDLKRAMMLEMFLFKKRDDALEKALKIKEELFENGSDEEVEDETMDNEECDAFSTNDCKCALCHCMNTIYVRWENWTPTTPFETIFQKHINDMN